MRIMQEKNSQNANLILNRLKSACKIDNETDLAKALNVKPSTLSGWKTRGIADYESIFALCESKGVNLNWVITGTNDKEKPSKAGTPLIPLEAVAGFAKGTGEAVFEFEVDYYNIPEFNKRADFLIRVSGESMSPKYPNGDIVACKKLPLDAFFQWNRVYVLDTTQGPLIKRVQRGSKEGLIRLVSDNENYEPFEISVKSLNALALVVGLIHIE